MKILVTGAKGFVGKNLVAELRNKGYTDIKEFNRETDQTLLDEYTSDCDFVFHLAGINRSIDEKEYLEGNFGLTSKLLESLKRNNNKSRVLISSSIQAEKDNLYGKSKKAVEELVSTYSQDTGVNTLIYRLPNVFGKWSRPNYNTVVATYCHNISRGIDIQINNPEADLILCYIDDVLREFMRAMEGSPTHHQSGGYYVVLSTYRIKLGDLAALIRSFTETRINLGIPDMNDELTKKLYSTYLSFIPEDDFIYDLNMHNDHRGSFTEFIKTPARGQVSVNVSKPGIVKGNHWHHTKAEKFMVVTGKGLTRFRKVDSEEIHQYEVNGDTLQVVDIPPGYVHSIVNIGDSDLVTIMWANETFDPENPDTFYVEV